MEFLTTFDFDQAYSILNYILQNPMENIDNLVVDNIPPIIFFNEYFFGEIVKLESNQNLSGPFSTENGNSFLININLEQFEGPNPISKTDLISGLIYDVTDNRDGSLQIVDEEILIYKEVINSDSLVDSINSVGNYILKINIKDLGQNQNNVTIVISVV